MKLTNRRVKKLEKTYTKEVQKETRQVVVCRDCGNLFPIEETYIEFDLQTNEKEFQCKYCNEKEPKGTLEDLLKEK